ncbi:hypothetical protein Lalb_Chr03g0027001 [Lupinus albus]|uniref:Uncharacterized protein n=1 Tax=Lupinus albus TaxID=3870 RepID=A0A6A4QUU4_LUPAL|nr:hypothetical protein Lalb_Chr03g0027001 [Lupinus albus]
MDPCTDCFINLFLQSPRRDCCRVQRSHKSSTMHLWVGSCRGGEVNLLDESKFRPPPPLIDFEGLEELMMLQQKPVW